MAKYSTAFKLRVIRSHHRQGVGTQTTALRFGLDRGTVRKWLAAHRLHGRAGLEKRYGRYSVAVKLQVLVFLEQEGGSIRQACAHFNIPAASTILSWRRRYERGGVEALISRPRGRPMSPPTKPTPPPEKADGEKTPEELREELAYLRAENAYLKKLKALAQAKRSRAGKKRGSSKS